MPNYLIVEGDSWRYFKGTEEPPVNWKDISFDDSSWLLGPSGFGYGDNDDNTLLSDMRENYASLYIRKDFFITDLEQVKGLLLEVDYDDGFVAYINGVEIARGNVSGNPPLYNSTANGPHESSAGGDPASLYGIDNSSLVAGTNIISVQGHNEHINNFDFSLITSLSVEYYEVNWNVIGSGSIEINPVKDFYLYNDTIITSATANTGWYFNNWSGDHTGGKNPDTIIVASDLDINVNFIEITSAPNPPLDFHIDSTSTYTVDIIWTDNALDEDVFEIERALDELGPFTLFATLPANTTYYSDQDVEKGTKYCYRIRAKNFIGSSSYVGPICTTTGTVASFTIVGLPDTQHYTDGVGSPDIFTSQTEWIVDNIVRHNIVFVSHFGDCVENGDNGGDDSEWQIVDSAMSIIEDTLTTQMLYGMPYGMSVGNHDQSPFGNSNGTTIFYNQFFGFDRFAGRDYYGGHYGSNNDNNFQIFSAENMDFILISLEYAIPLNVDVMDWADSLLQAHSSRRAIIVSHRIIGTGNPANFDGQGLALYNGLKHHPNMFLMLCGHVLGEGQRTDVYDGNTVYSLLADYQGRPNGGDGWMRLMTFYPETNEIKVRTYSPFLDEWETDVDSEFSLYYEMQEQIDNCDVKIDPTSCGNFEVKLIPNADIINKTLTNTQFTIKWPENTVNLDNFYSDFGVTLQSSAIYNGSNYAVFVSSANIPINWTEGTEYTILSFSHDYSSNGYANFEIASDSWTDANNGNYYVEVLGGDCTGIIVAAANNVYLGRCGEFKALLQGGYNTNGNMDKGLAGNIPLSQPYNISPWNYGGLESFTVMDTNVVDWVLLELRSDPFTMVERKAALLLYDGSIVQYNNTLQGVHFDNVIEGSSYFVVVHHRNHMPVMTALPALFDGTIVNFTDEAICYGAPNVQVELETDIYGMIAGDINSNGLLSYSGPGNDRGLVLARIVDEENTTDINDITFGYYSEDVLLDYFVKYIGASNDRSIILANMALLTGSNYLNAAYNSVVPLVTTKSESLNNGPIHIFLDETENNVRLKIITDKDIFNGIVDNIQFTLSWSEESDELIVPLIDNVKSEFGLLPQGEATYFEGRKYQVFVSVMPATFPETFAANDVLILASFVKNGPVTFGSAIEIADDEFALSQNGAYYISLLGKDYSGAILNTPLDIADIKDTEYSIYPNPVKNGVVHIELNFDKAQNGIIEVMDIQNKKIYSQLIQINAGKSNNEINLSSLQQGIYFISIKAENFNVIHKLILY